MKKFILTLCLCSLFLSCSDQDDDLNNSGNEMANQINANMVQGNWMITLYNDSGQNETSDYNGFGFTFASNGELTATNGAVSYSGTWSVGSESNSIDDSSSSDVDFNIFFSAPPEFNELSDDWDVVRYSDNKIELSDVSGGDGITDLLTFEKI